MSFWVDVILFSLLVVFGSLFILLQTGKVEKSEDNLDVKIKRNYLYPQRLIRQAGLPISGSHWLYWSVKCSSLVFSLLLFVELQAKLPLALLLFVVILVLLLPELWCVVKRYRRQEKIEKSMEFFVSLMIAYLKSGTNLSSAFKMAAYYGLDAKNPLSEEVLLIACELDSGREPNRAFQDLASRTGVKSLYKLAAVVGIGLQVGAPVIDNLKSNLDVLRLSRRKKISERINRKSLETMLPMLMVCFPMFLVLVFFPAGIQVLDVLKLLAEIL